MASCSTWATPGSHDARLVFPPFEVAAGSFIVVHLKPSGEPARVDETTDPAASKGFDAADTAFDFWLRDGRGLGGNNGVLSLCDRPGGACLDGVLYSNRTSSVGRAVRGLWIGGDARPRGRAGEDAGRGRPPVPGSRRRTGSARKVPPARGRFAGHPHRLTPIGRRTGTSCRRARRASGPTTRTRSMRRRLPHWHGWH